MTGTTFLELLKVLIVHEEGKSNDTKREEYLYKRV